LSVLVLFTSYISSFFTRTSLLPKSCPALPTAHVFSQALLLVYTTFNQQERSFWLPQPPPYLVLAYCFSMSYIQQALISSVYSSTLQERPGQHS